MSDVVRVVKVPVSIMEDDEKIRRMKYRALDKVMYESQYLGNTAIRMCVALGMKELTPTEIDSETGKEVSLDTRIYRLISPKRKLLNSGSLSSMLRNYAAKLYRTSNKDAWAGRKSIPTIRNPFVYIRHQGTKIVALDGKTVQFQITPSGFNGQWIPDTLISEISDLEPSCVLPNQRTLVLKSVFSWKDKGSADIVSRVISGEYKMCDSQITKENGRLFFALSFRKPVIEAQLDPNKVCGVDLGVVIPAVCALAKGKERAYLGNGDDVWAARSRFRSLRRREQSRNGLYDLSNNWNRSESEDRWIQNYYHCLTREIVKFCLKNGCGVVHVEDLSSLRSKQQDNEYRRLMWVPSKLVTMLGHKVDEYGISMVIINPRNTSRRCPECDHIDKGNRVSQSQFVCQKCGYKDNADYVGARNIAMASGEVVDNGYVSEKEAVA